MKRLGMQDVFGESGSAAELLRKYRLDAEGVYESVKESYPELSAESSGGKGGAPQS